MYDDLLQNSLETLRSGGVILYPTDTVWGIGCDATNADAVEKIYNIKRRDHTKSMLILADPQSFRTGNETIDRLLLDCDRPTTVIIPISCLPVGITLADDLPSADKTIGIRLPRHQFCQELIRRLGNPIVSTSANYSGKPTPATYDEISVRLKQAVDYCVPNLPQFEGNASPSRILKYNPNGEITTIRN